MYPVSSYKNNIQVKSEILKTLCTLISHNIKTTDQTINTDCGGLHLALWAVSEQQFAWQHKWKSEKKMIRSSASFIHDVKQMKCLLPGREEFFFHLQFYSLVLGDLERGLKLLGKGLWIMWWCNSMMSPLRRSHHGVQNCCKTIMGGLCLVASSTRTENISCLSLKVVWMFNKVVLMSWLFSVFITVDMIFLRFFILRLKKKHTYGASSVMIWINLVHGPDKAATAQVYRCTYWNCTWTRNGMCRHDYVKEAFLLPPSTESGLSSAGLGWLNT